MADRYRTFILDDGSDEPDDAIGRYRVRPRPRRIRAKLAPLIVALLGLAALAAVVTAWIQLVPGDPMRRRVPVDPASIPPAIEPVALMPIAPEAARELNETRPFDVVGPIARAPRFRFVGDGASRARALGCLAAAAWYEAGDDALGQESVIQVVLNRARHPAFPRSICGVVFQGSERTTGCQFTFTCDGAMDRRTPAAAAWGRAIALASMMIDGAVDPQVGAATHYHTDWVMPYWAPTLVKLAKVRTHIFYTWPGRWGSPALLVRATAEEPVVAALARLSPAHVAADAATTGMPVDPAMMPGAGAPTPTDAGIGDRTLRGAIVRSNQGDSGRFFIQIDAGTFAGNHAVAALALCKGRASCRVYGWRDAGSVAAGLPLSDAQRDALSFYFAHDQNGEDRAMWNCAQIARSNAAQCLPVDPAARAAVTG